MNRWWSLLFLLVPVLGIATFIAAAFRIGSLDWWLPESIGPRTRSIDGLFNFVHVILGVVFAATGLCLAITLWRFEKRQSARARMVRSNKSIEIAWIIAPAAILVFLSLLQLSTWNKNKLYHPEGLVDGLQAPLARVQARQFGWRFVYPGEDGIFATKDDVFQENELVVPLDEMIVLEMESQDVIHSLCIPNLRLKQDIVPGLKPRIWFEVSKKGTWDIVCAELCGWGHYKMSASLVAVDADEFQKRMDRLIREQRYDESP